ncbi:hypothetical protein [Methanosphaera cuniculi]|uniref:hypothetical protein n=1 Tax=Methanosphaera cuniculi TaxID=1077256 RepID=UPI0026F04D4B|nr:hypothetical protein [Methanosphaera cuniculi]
MNIVENENKNLIVEEIMSINVEQNKYTKKNGDVNIYKVYTVTIPKFILSLFDNNYIYLYDMGGSTYMTDVEPSPTINFEKRKLVKKGKSLRIALPKNMFSFSSDSEFIFSIDMNRYDFISSKRGLLEVQIL